MIVSQSILVILLSFLVGSAAVLSFATGFREQIAGVAVAIAIVPPIAAVGIGLKMHNFIYAGKAASIAFINILSIIISGFITLRALGMKPSTYYRKKQAENMIYLVPIAFILLILFAIPIISSSFNNYEEQLNRQKVEKIAEERFGNKLLEVRFQRNTAQIIIIASNKSSDLGQNTFPSSMKTEIIELETR